MESHMAHMADFNMCLCKVKHFPNGEINERSFCDPAREVAIFILFVGH